MASTSENAAVKASRWLRKREAFERIVFVALGLLLLVTALLKFQGVAAEIEGPGSLEQLSVAVIECATH